MGDFSFFADALKKKLGTAADSVEDRQPVHVPGPSTVMSVPAQRTVSAPATTASTDSPTRQRYLSEQASLPTEPDYIAAHRPQGAGQRALSALKLGGRMLVQSGLNPLVGVEGLAIGGLDKDAYARDVYRTSVEPRSVARQQRYAGQAREEQDYTRGQVATAADQQRMQLAASAGQREQEQFDYEKQFERPYRQKIQAATQRHIDAQTTELEAKAEKERRTLPEKQFPPVQGIHPVTGHLMLIDPNDPSAPPRDTGAMPARVPGGAGETDTTTEDVYGLPPGGETVEQYETRHKAAMDRIDQTPGIKAADRIKLIEGWERNNPRPDRRPVKMGTKTTKVKGGTTVGHPEGTILKSNKRPGKFAKVINGKIVEGSIGKDGQFVPDQ